VDDSAETSRSLSRLLTLLGYDARTVDDGPEAVEAASEFRPDVVLMDIDLPGMDGYEATRRLRDQSWGTGVFLIALTAFEREIDGRRFREAGFDHHLAKPRWTSMPSSI
jgi:CheY-like chemotaxis protein